MKELVYILIVMVGTWPCACQNLQNYTLLKRVNFTVYKLYLNFFKGENKEQTKKVYIWCPVASLMSVILNIYENYPTLTLLLLYYNSALSNTLDNSSVQCWLICTWAPKSSILGLTWDTEDKLKGVWYLIYRSPKTKARTNYVLSLYEWFRSYRRKNFPTDQY